MFRQKLTFLNIDHVLVTTANGTAFYEGDLQSGSSPSQVTFEGDVVFGSTATTEIKLAGTNLGEFDQLVVNGDLTLDGILFVTAIDGFQLQPGMQFEVSDVGMKSCGQFSGLAQGSVVANINGVDLTIDYNDVVLNASSGVLLGDVNLDGVVNLLDCSRSLT